jgi:hypothetical protein
MARRWSPVTVAVILAVLAGCSDSGRETGRDTDVSTTTVKRTTTTVDTPTSADTSPTTSSAPSPSADEAVVAAYVAFWDRYVQIGSTPPPFNPEATRAQLVEFTSGDETAQLFEFFQNNATTGVVVRGETEHSPTVESNDGTVALVRDCMDDRTGAFRIADDSRIDTDDPARRTYLATLRLDGSTWKVERVTTEPEPCTV